MAKSSLSRDARDREALLAMTFAKGLRSDFAALIEKRNLASLHYTKEATAWASQLLAVDPACYDAHLAGGVSRYIVGSMAAPVRWILRLGGVAGDKAGGIAELQTTAAKAVCSPRSLASCWPSPTSARKTCRAPASCCWGCNENFPRTLSLAGNWRDSTRTAANPRVSCKKRRSPRLDGAVPISTPRRNFRPSLPAKYLENQWRSSEIHHVVTFL